VDQEWRRLEEVHAAQQQVARRERELQSLVEQQSFAAAAGQRDALVAAQLRLRQLQLQAAGAHKACAGVGHRLGQVVVHARYHYRGVIVGYDHECRAPESWIKVGASRSAVPPDEPHPPPPPQASRSLPLLLPR
jgi:hypothetical protein